MPLKISILLDGGIDTALANLKSFDPSLIVTSKVIDAVVLVLQALRPIIIWLLDVAATISVSLAFVSVTSVDLKLFAIIYPPKAIAKGIAFGSLSPSMVTVDGIVAVAPDVLTSKTVTKALPL